MIAVARWLTISDEPLKQLPLLQRLSLDAASIHSGKCFANAVFKPIRNSRKTRAWLWTVDVVKQECCDCCCQLAYHFRRAIETAFLDNSPLQFWPCKRQANVLQTLFSNLFVTAGKPGLGFGLSVLAGVANITLDYVFTAPAIMSSVKSSFAS